MRRAAAAAVVLVAACDRRAPLATCDDPLGGVYAVGDRRWMIVDAHHTVTAFPLFDDVAGVPPSTLELAPRMLELQRAGAGAVAGKMRRRYMQAAASCTGEAPARLTACTGDTLELVVGDPEPPLGFGPCRWPRLGPTRLERWRRE